MKKVVIIVLTIALIITGFFAAKYQGDKINTEYLLSIKGTQITCFENQIQQYKEQYEERIVGYEDRIAEYKDKVGQFEEQVDWYKVRVLQLEDEINFYKRETQYWKEMAAFGSKAAGQDRLGEFNSVEELQQWLVDDPISEHKWVFRLYDCDNFATDLTLSALSDGYWIGLGATDIHLFNFTIIGNDVYRIEASQDKVEPWGTLD